MKTVSSHIGAWPGGDTKDEKRKLGHEFDGSVSSKLSVGSNGSQGAGPGVTVKRDFSGMGFGRQGEKTAGLRGYLISKPLESVPRYAPNTKAGDSE